MNQAPTPAATGRTSRAQRSISGRSDLIGTPSPSIIPVCPEWRFWQRTGNYPANRAAIPSSSSAPSSILRASWTISRIITTPNSDCNWLLGVPSHRFRHRKQGRPFFNSLLKASRYRLGSSRLTGQATAIRTLNGVNTNPHNFRPSELASRASSRASLGT